MNGELVLVTGGSGFIGAHCILQLLQAGYSVRTTVRSLKRAPEIRNMLLTGGANSVEDLTFIETDLMSDNGWAEAVIGCNYVLHVASPFPIATPKDEDELIMPARDGALRVLRAARDAKISRVVLTSSFAAIGYGQNLDGRIFTEEDWTDPANSHISTYIKSKTMAERAAWDFIAADGGTLELSVINPSAVFGPVLGPDYSTSIQLIKRLLDGSLPFCPRLSYIPVDVRDVANLHVRAMTDPAANGERFLAVSGESMTMLEMARVLKTHFGDSARRVPTSEMPDWLVRLFSLADPAIKQIAPELGKVKNASNEKARRLLGWSPRSKEETVIATADSLLQLGLV